MIGVMLINHSHSIKCFQMSAYFETPFTYDFSRKLRELFPLILSTLNDTGTISQLLGGGHCSAPQKSLIFRVKENNVKVEGRG